MTRRLKLLQESRRPPTTIREFTRMILLAHLYQRASSAIPERRQVITCTIPPPTARPNCKTASSYNQPCNLQAIRPGYIIPTQQTTILPNESTWKTSLVPPYMLKRGFVSQAITATAYCRATSSKAEIRSNACTASTREQKPGTWANQPKEWYQPRSPC